MFTAVDYGSTCCSQSDWTTFCCSYNMVLLHKYVNIREHRTFVAMEEGLTLVVRAANGKFEDFNIECKRSWTVKDLKQCLARQHPSHTPYTCQKLICAGKLLTDVQRIQDIAPETTSASIIVHLVMFERSLSAPAVQAQHTAPTWQEERGDEQGNTGSQGSSVSQGPVHMHWQEERGDEQGNSGSQGSSVSQGPVHMHHQESHSGVAHWPRFRGTYPQWLSGVPLGTYPPGFSNYPLPQAYMLPYNSMLAAQMAQFYQNYQARQLSVDDGDDGEEQAEVDQDLQNLPGQPGGQELEENAIAMNAGIGGMDAANMQRRRDIVDYLYMLTMAAFLAAMAFMTGSLGRFLIFAAGIVFMLMNQAGWFSVQRQRRQEGAADHVAPVPETPPSEPQTPPVPETPPSEPQTPPVPETLPSESQTAPVAAPQAVPDLQNPSDQTASQASCSERSSYPTGQQTSLEDRLNEAQVIEAAENVVTVELQVAQPMPTPGVLNTIMVFVTSFFTSLVPQHRQPVQFN